MRLLQIFSRFMNGNMSETFYREHAKTLQQTNYALLRRGVVFSTCMCVFLFVLTMLQDIIYDLRWFYVTYTLLFAGMTFLVLTVVKRNKQLVRLYYYLFVTATFVLTIQVGTVITPELPAVAFFVFLIIMPMLYVTRPVHAAVVSLLACVAFCITTVVVKGTANAYLAHTDMLNAICCCIVGIAVDATILNLHLENIQAKSYFERKSSTDELTGLSNRRQFNLYIDECYAASVSGKGNLCVLMMDVDNFKHYNDTCGHLAGDECLRVVGRALRKTANAQNAFLARYGGEEFVAVAKCSEQAQLREVAEHFVSCVYDLNQKHTGCAWGRITMSVGYADLRSTRADSYMTLINCADDALYAAKSAGKNQARGYVDRAIRNG